ncbi:MAG: HigA family addiction module antidote protein [Bacteroidales bacterium]|nr:HigA family addiction module antidote protein [Bacteroidales bacterium]
METRNDVRPCLPVHPGGILKEELRERGIKQKTFAEMIGMRPSHLNALLHGSRNISPQLAARIEDALHIPARVWLNLQLNYNLDTIRTSELVDGYEYQPRPAFVLSEQTRQDKEVWDVAFRAGQKDAVRKITKALQDIGMTEEQIKEVTNNC